MGEGGGVCSSVVTLFFAKKSWYKTDRCAGELSWRGNKLLVLHILELFLLTASLKRQMISKYLSLFAVAISVNNTSEFRGTAWSCCYKWPVLIKRYKYLDTRVSHDIPSRCRLKENTPAQMNKKLNHNAYVKKTFYYICGNKMPTRCNRGFLFPHINDDARSKSHQILLYVWVTVHHKSIIYNKPTRCNSGSTVFTDNYKYALHVLDALCVHHQEHYKL